MIIGKRELREGGEVCLNSSWTNLIVCAFSSEAWELSCSRGRVLTKPFHKLPLFLCSHWNNRTQMAEEREGGEVAGQCRRRAGDYDQKDKLWLFDVLFGFLLGFCLSEEKNLQEQLFHFPICFPTDWKWGWGGTGQARQVSRVTEIHSGVF